MVAKMLSHLCLQKLKSEPEIPVAGYQTDLDVGNT